MVAPNVELLARVATALGDLRERGFAQTLEEGEPPYRWTYAGLKQEQFARSMGEGHRVIHGVAGSGKTMVLGYRLRGVDCSCRWLL